MAKKKTKFKPLTTQQLKKNKGLFKLAPLLLLTLGVAVGLLIAWLQPPDLYPKNLVWKADASVVLPRDLAEFLRNQQGCHGYRGPGTSRGVGLWGVYQTSKNKFAKVSRGCSTNLTTYIMAVKDKGSWQLLQPAEYFANQSTTKKFLPNCLYIGRYKIDESIEPFCIEMDGTPRENNID